MAHSSGRRSSGASRRQPPRSGQNGGSVNHSPYGAASGGSSYPPYSQQEQQTYAGGTNAGGLTPAQKKARLQRKKEILRRRRKHRRMLFAAAFLLIVGIAFVLIRMLSGTAGSATDAGLDEVDTAAAEEDNEDAGYTGPAKATIAFVGDISTSADQVAAVTRSDGTYDFSKPFEGIASLIDGADYAVGDFETTMVDGMSFGGQPYYNSPVQLAGSLRELGFRLMSTANTYMLNNGIDGLTSTKKYLEDAKLKTVGTYLSQEDRDKNGGAYICTIHNIKFAFLAYTKGTDSVMMPEGCEYALNTLYTDYSDYWTELRSSQIQKDVQAAKNAGADVIVALVHWGSEYGRTISEPQQEAADLLMKSGVNVIVGSHSHLVGEMGFQKVTVADGTTNNCFVAYSLGDFYTDPTDTAAQASVILNLTFDKQSDGNVKIDASYVPIYQNITESNGKRSFAVVDVYQQIAELKRMEQMTSAQAKYYNTLLGVVSDIHDDAGEELDAGPTEADQRMVNQALEDGAISTQEIKNIKKQEEQEAAAAKEAMGDVSTSPDGTGEEQSPTETPAA